MSAEAIEQYLGDDSRRGPAPDGACTGAAGGAACGDLVRISIVARNGTIEAVSFDAEGCAATRAAAAVATELVEGSAVLEAARLEPAAISVALGELAPTHLHAADLAADAVHRALSRLASSRETLAPPTPGRVLVALSGGVDSAVVAWLERERGADVVAVTLKLWADRRTDGERSCCSPEAVMRARSLAHRIGIPHLTLDLEETFRAEVVEGFLAGYAAGRTPNPCVRCNGEVRIDAMISLAERCGAEALATGHYARLVDDGQGPLLTAASDPAKDQTYMLSALDPASLARLRFPLGDLTKPRVREIAVEAGLPVASRPESQDLCFLAGQGKREFLRRHAGLRDRPGKIVDRGGRSLGRHRGHHHFTVGQRKGIGVAAPEPLYVLETDAEENTVTVGPHGELARDTIALRDAVLHRPGAGVDRVRLRYHSEPLGCRPLDAEPGRHERIELSLTEPAAGVAPGQTASLLSGGAIVGHATIA